MRACIAVLILTCMGCAPLGNEMVGDDNYSSAAMSWLGADIQEMLAVWPNPNMKCGSNKDGQAGCAWWRHSRGSHDVPISGGSGAMPYNYDCETVVHYDAAGVITDIDLKRSRYCDRRFGDRIDSMTQRDMGADRASIDI